MIKRILLSIILVSCCLLASPLSAQAKDILGSSAECNTGGSGTGNSAICAGNPAAGSGDPVIDKLKNITLIVAYVAGAAAVLLLLISSIQYITSNGDANKAGSAKNTIIYALVGIAVVVLATTIIEFVINKL